MLKCKFLLDKLQPRNRVHLFWLFTIGFSITVILTFLPFFLFDVSLIRASIDGSNCDGFRQHYEYLVWLKHTIVNLFAGNGFSFWSWNVGLGADTIGSFAAVFFDPFNYIAVIFPDDQISVAYTIGIYLRLYFAGLGFLYFGKTAGLSLKHSLWGAFAYSLSSWAITAALNQVVFLPAMLLFGFMMAGVTKVLRNQSPIVLIISVALSAMNSVYFSYMAAIMIFIYLLVYFIKNESKTIQNYIHYWGRLILYVGTALCLSAVAVIPSVYLLLHAVKEGSTDYSFFHALSVYINYPASLIGGQQIFYHYSTIFVCPIFLLMIPSILHHVRMRKATPAMITFIISLVFLLFPFFNSMFNGFSYPMGRWCYTATFFYIWSAIECLAEGSFDISRYKKHIVIMLTFCGFMLYIAGRVILNINNELNTIIGVLSLGFAALFYQQLKKNSQWHCSTITLSVMLNIILFGFIQFLPGISSYITNYSEHGAQYKQMQYATQSAGTEIEDDTFYRIDQVDHISPVNQVKGNEYKSISNRVAHNPANETLVYQTRSIYTYLSVTNGALYEFYKNVGNNASYSTRVWTYSNDNRTRLDFLSGVKYFLGSNPNNNPPTGAENYASYGFSDFKKSSKGINILKNKYSIGLGCAYDTYITETEWLKLDYPDREQALMQCIILPDNTETSLTHADYHNISSGSQKAAYHIAASTNIVSKNTPLKKKFKNLEQAGSLKVTNTANSFTLHIDGEYQNCELFLIARNLKRDPKSTIKTNYYGKSMSKLNRIRAKLKTGANFDDYGGFTIDVSNSAIKKRAINTLGNVQGFSDIKDFMINLGQYNEKAKDLTISLNTVGTYSYDSFELLAVPLSTYESKAVSCANNAYNIDTFSDNYVKGTIGTDKDSSMLYLSIPYSDGWKAYVDGKEVSTQQIDIAFTGIPVNDAGKHTVELRYRPVGFKIGIIAFTVGLFSCILICIWSVKRKKEQGNLK